MNDVDLVLVDEASETAQLSEKVQIVKAGKPVFENFSKADLLCIGAQGAAILQACQMNTAPAALVQLPQQLQSLALTAALLKTVNDE